DQQDFEAIVSPIYDYANSTTARSPFVDSYETHNLRSDGMHARPVIGGVFIKMLADPRVWKTWAARDQAKVGNWADAPVPPRLVTVVPTAQEQPAMWKYTTAKPSDEWTK